MQSTEQKPQVLVIDDDEKIVSNFKAVLGSFCLVDEAYSGQEAIGKILRTNYDVIVSDYNMNNGNGLFLLEKLNESKMEVPFILVSGHANTKIAIQFANLHVFKILEKPASPLELISSVQEAVKFSYNLKLNKKHIVLGKNTGQIIHDLNNHLGIISVSSEMGLTTTKDELAKKSFERNLKACDKIKSMVEKYKKFLSNKNEIKLTEMPLANYLEALKEEWEGFPVELELKISNTSKAALDKILMQQVFLNLFKNAQDACENNELNIKITCTESDKAFYIQVKDNGEGIPNSVKEKLFEEGVSSKGDKGTGMGLSYCRHIVDIHLGTINLESTSPEGTSFIIQLPKIKE